MSWGNIDPQKIRVSFGRYTKTDSFGDYNEGFEHTFSGSLVDGLCHLDTSIGILNSNINSVIENIRSLRYLKPEALQIVSSEVESLENQLKSEINHLRQEIPDISGLVLRGELPDVSNFVQKEGLSEILIRNHDEIMKRLNDFDKRLSLLEQKKAKIEKIEGETLDS